MATRHPVRRLALPLRRSGTLWSAAIVVAAALPYLNALRCGFAFDDFGLVVQNPFAEPGMPPWAWFARESTTRSLYRPVTMVSYGLEHVVGAGPFTFHLTNVVLHVLASLAAFELARLLLRSVPGGAAVGLLFAVHPIHTEPVTNVAGRSEVLAGLFAFATLIAFIRGRGAERPWAWSAVAVVAFAAGACSKESGVVTLGLAGLVAVWLWRPPPAELLRRLAPLAVVALGFVALRAGVTGSLTLREPPPFLENPIAHTDLWTRLATALVVLGEYVSVLVVPLRLSADDSFDQVPIVTTPTDPRLLLTTAVLAAACAAMWRLRRRRPVFLLAAGFFAVGMAITANVLFPIGVMKADRLLYLPSFGWCLAAGWALRRWVGNTVGPRMAVVGLALCLLGARTWVRNEDWRSNHSIFMKTVATSPNSARAHSNAAAVAGNAGDLDFAFAHYSEALRIHPRSASAAQGLGRIHELRGHADEAIRWYTEAVRHDPDRVKLYATIGDLLIAGGRSADAEAMYREGLTRAPADPALIARMQRLRERPPAADRRGD